MKVFLDTSVFVAAFWGDHAQHPASVRLVKGATPKTAFCAAHTVAEVYSTMTRLPVKPPIPTEQALLFIRQIREQFCVVTLTGKEYFETVERLAAYLKQSGRSVNAEVCSTSLAASLNAAALCRVALLPVPKTVRLWDRSAPVSDGDVAGAGQCCLFR